MAIFFDLDGTLLDTAYDFTTVLNKMRLQKGLADNLVSKDIQPHLSYGLKKMVQVSLELKENHKELEQLTTTALKMYNSLEYVSTVPFTGVEKIIDFLQQRQYIWGIITNRVERNTKPLLTKLGWMDKISCLVCADTTDFPKPHPMPLLHACDILGLEPENCLFIGDDMIDINAGIAAKMPTVAALYGYGNASNEKATYSVKDTAELFEFIKNKII